MAEIKRRGKMKNFVTTSSGLKIAVTHEEVTKDRAVIIAPGFFTSKDTKTYKNIARDLKKEFDVISMDFRGHGKSEGYYSYSANEKEDLKAVIDYARGHYAKVGVVGFSYGGTIAMIQAAEYKNVDSLICVGSPMASEEIEFKWWKPEAFRLGLMKFEWGNGVRTGNPFLKKIRPIDVVHAIAPTPILFMHGTGDPTVDHRHSLKLHEAAREPKAVKIFENGSHAEEIYRRFPEAFLNEVNAWFKKTL
jgi:alpha-beta hydrolase superfamily lysophospholipase